MIVKATMTVDRATRAGAQGVRGAFFVPTALDDTDWDAGWPEVCCTHRQSDACAPRST